MLDGKQDGTCIENYDVFPHQRNHRKPPVSTPRDPKVAATPQGSPRDSPVGQRKSHPRPKLNTSNRHLARWSEASRDLTRTDLELLLNLTRSEARPTSEACWRLLSRTANAKPFPDASVLMQTSSQRRLQSLRKRHRIPPNALRSFRTVHHGPPETKTDARANLKLASRVERVPRLLSARKDS